MHIVYIYKNLALWGGIERILTNKMNYLCEQYGHNVTIITTCQGNHTPPYQLSPKVKHIDLNIRFHTQYQYSLPKRIVVKYLMNRKFAKLLKEKIKQLKPDILVVTTDMYMDVATKYFKDIPIIAESHSTKNYLPFNIETSNFIKTYIHHQYLKSAHKVTTLVTLSEGDAQEWNLPKKTIVIPNLVQPNNTGRYSTCENKQILFVGRFSKQKGLDNLLKIGKFIQTKHPDWQLHIYGEGELKVEFTGLIQREKLSTHIIVHEPTSHIDEAYINSSIHISTSKYEPFGLVLCEAMTYGLPNIAFDCPYGPRNIITDQEDGFLIKNGNIKNYINKIDYLIEHENIRKRMGEKAIENVKRFYPENIMPLWNELFNNILKHKNENN